MIISAGVFATESPYKKNFKTGSPDIQSINALTFGPEGILFIGDSKTAMITAFSTNDTQAAKAEKISVKNLDLKIAAVLGTSADEIEIQDLAVNPISKNIYIAVQTAGGSPVLLKMAGDKITNVSLNNISYDQASINAPVSVDTKDRRGNSQRVWAVSDLGFHKDKVMVSGLSNKEFSSTFRSINFPFNKQQKQSSLEIYHAAHGRYETYAPIKAFTAATVGGKEQLIASYTCTPLVLFPMETLKPGTHVKGRTVAELGNWNTPLDMIVMEKGGEAYLLMANSSRALMKIRLEDMAAESLNLTSRVEERSGTAGVPFVNLPFVNVQQLDKVDDQTFLILQRRANGDLDLYTETARWL